MQPTKTRDANRLFTPPGNWKPELDGNCGNLEVRVTEDWGKRNLVNCVSTFKPTAEELAHLNRGGVIELSIIGAQPPVGLSVVDPVEADAGSHDEHGPAAP